MPTRPDVKEYQELKEHLEKLVSPIPCPFPCPFPFPFPCPFPFPLPFPDLSSPQVGQINGRFSTCRWSPIRYIYGCVPQAQLAGFYRQEIVFLNSRTIVFLHFWYSSTLGQLFSSILGQLYSSYSLLQQTP